jgi:hypothetical protein
MKNKSNLIKRLIFASNIKTATTLPVVISFLFLIGTLLIGQKIYGQAYPDYYSCLITVVSLVIFGISGLIQVVRKEGVGVVGSPVKGIWPVLTGWLLLIVTWGSALYLLFYYFKTNSEV